MLKANFWDEAGELGPLHFHQSKGERNGMQLSDTDE
jgi:hypothetical protein